MKIQNPEIQEFFNANLNADLHSLLLKKTPFPEVTMQQIVQQIKGRKVAAKKFPFLLKDGIVFPPNLNLEQASSEATGKYKSDLVSGKNMVDLTCGFGIDAWFLSGNFEEITLIEQNPALLNIVQNNWQILGRKATFLNCKLEDFLSANNNHFDLIYLDPARRNEQKNKVFLLEDLSPNLLEIQEKLFGISQRILVKLSPLIDLSYLVSVLKNIAEIHIVAVKNEVKEILVLMDSQAQSYIKVKCINLETDEPVFQFVWGGEAESDTAFAEPSECICIPNNAVLKSGAYNLLSAKFGISRLHPNTQLYTSANPPADFPGRILQMEKIDAGQIKKGEQFNIISKNHPLKPEEIRKKYKLKDGGSKYLIFTQSLSGKIILKSK